MPAKTTVRSSPKLANTTQANGKTCWVVTDGRAGIENQALGLAQAIGLPYQVKRIRLKFPWTFLPAEFFPFLLTLRNPLPLIARKKDHIDPPWPDVLVATGRQSIPMSLAIKKASGNKTFTIQTQSPRVHASYFDLVVPPHHDLLAGPNVEPILGSPNKITDELLDKGKQSIMTRIAHLPRPLVAVLIGGNSKQHKMPEDWTKCFCSKLLALARSKNVGLMVTASRRTGKANMEILSSRLKAPNIYFWDGRGDNPYFGMLATADYFIVTSDSTNMITEAAATGKPVHIAHLPGGSAKFDRFYRDMTEYGAARPFEGKLEDWSYRPLRETQRIAQIVRDKLGIETV